MSDARPPNRSPESDESHETRDRQVETQVNLEVAGDDALVARGFWRSLAVIAAVLALVVTALLWQKPAAKDAGSSAATQPPAPAPAESFEAPQPVAFVDVALAAGVDFIHESGARGSKLLPECLGGGVAIVDLDADGLHDLVFTQGQPIESDARVPDSADLALRAGGIRVYRNRSSNGALAFDHLVALDSVITNCNATGLAVGDLNGDGRADVYVASVDRDRLLLNATQQGGPIMFTDATDSFGVPNEHEWGTSAGMFDADNDGDLDILVANYVQWSPAIDLSVNYTLDGVGRAYGPPTGFEGSLVTLLRNDGTGLTDVTRESGVDVRNPVTGAPYAKALGLAFADVDGDGRVDVFVANDRTPKFLLRNLGPNAAGIPRFLDEAPKMGFAYDRDGNATGAMGIDATYVREGSELAVAVGNFANEPSSLYVRPEGSESFSDEALGQGYGAPTRSVLTFGTLFVDVDLDGDEDIVQANGHLEPDIHRVQPSQTYAQRGQLFLNRGGDAVPLFVEADPARIGDLATPAVGRGLASGDLDGDGDPDLVLVNLGGAARVLRNDQATGHSWVRVPATLDSRTGASGARAPTGSVAVVMWLSQHEGSAAKRHFARRIISSTRSYLSQCADEVIVGLGSGAAGTVELVEVRGGSTVRLRLVDVPVQRAPR